MSEFDKINQLFKDLLPQTTQPAYRYWSDNRKNRYFYTTEHLIIQGKKRWSSGIYRYLKNKKQYHLKKRVNHATRKGAKARAYKMYLKTKKVD